MRKEKNKIEQEQERDSREDAAQADSNTTRWTEARRGNAEWHVKS